MQPGDQTPTPQTAPALQPPRPPGPPTRTAIGLAPELPEPDDSQQRSSRLEATTPPHPFEARVSQLAAASPEPAKPLLAALDKVLAVMAAVVAVGSAIAVWVSLLVSAL